jgi:SAM-dependent methyltransferase
MTAFGRYATLYDLFYRDRDYDGEIAFVRKKLDQHAPQARSILDAGCGTGRHASALAHAGYDVAGVDASSQMIEQARSQVTSGPTFQVADLRQMDLGAEFDAAIALFHVVGYLATSADVERGISSIRRHLRVGGLFLFDFWYGPRVLVNEPLPRRKSVASNGQIITRVAEPRHLAHEQVVEVLYRIEIERGADEATEQFSELHRMRYFFRPELDGVLDRLGFSPVEFGSWPAQPDDSYWHYIAARAV